MGGAYPKLLFLARDFPPVEQISTIRLQNIAKHLSRLDWQVTIVRPSPSLLLDRSREGEAADFVRKHDFHVIDTGFNAPWLEPGLLKCGGIMSFRPINGMARRIERFLDLDKGRGWIHPIDLATSHLQHEDVDIILASGSPFSSFLAAERLARRLRRPYVLDYRDPWTLRAFNPVAVRPWTRWLERRVCREASAFLHVSEPLRQAHRAGFHARGQEHTLSNGFDPEDLDAVRPHSFDHPAVVYAGQFYPPHREIDQVIHAMSLLVKNGEPQYAKLTFHYFGAQGQMVQKAAVDTPMANRIVDHGAVSRLESWSALKGASATIGIVSVMEFADPDVLGTTTGKLFELMGLEARTLLIAPKGSEAVRIFNRSGTGVVCPGHDVPSLACALAQVLEGKIERPREKLAYSWPVLIRGLDEILRNIMEKQSDGRS